MTPLPLDDVLDRILRRGVTDLGGYLLLHYVADRLAGPPDPAPDMTGAEAYLNHVHPVPPGGGDVEECAGMAITALHLLRQQILGCEEAGQVRVVLSVGYHDIPSSSLRFYRRRPGEQWIVDDLESYETEAILVEDIG
ncbi:MAG: hypothetical protein ACRDYC_00425 [Acidimicrobiales bacterium]